MTDWQLFAGSDVSRETSERLDDFADLVVKWTARINLIGNATIGQVKERHIADSLQIVRLITTPPRSWADLGAGGGFPGIILAIWAKEHWPELVVDLVESDQRKAAFLRIAKQELGLRVRILDQRIEALEPLNAQILTARALAPLADLMVMAERHLAADGRAIFPKGRTALAEIEAVQQRWKFDLVITPSLTDQEASLLQIERIFRA